MKIRYKLNHIEACSSRFNTSAIDEILTEDNSVFISQVDIFLECKQEWKDMRRAFQDHDVITDNYNTYFFEPETDEDRERGFTL